MIHNSVFFEDFLLKGSFSSISHTISPVFLIIFSSLSKMDDIEEVYWLKDLFFSVLFKVSLRVLGIANRHKTSLTNQKLLIWSSDKAYWGFQRITDRILNMISLIKTLMNEDDSSWFLAISFTQIIYGVPTSNTK